MSKQRAKGTRWETELKGMLQKVFPHCDRAPLRGGADRGDFDHCAGWMLEAKAVDTPRFLHWARTCRDRRIARWVILWKGNRNTPDGKPLAMCSLETMLYLLDCERSLHLVRGDVSKLLAFRHYGPSHGLPDAESVVS